MTFVGFTSEVFLRDWQIPDNRISRKDGMITVVLSRSMRLLPEEYRLFTGKTKTAVIDGVSVTFKKPSYCAIVIDDVPMNWTFFKTSFLLLNIPMTFSVLPFELHAKEYADMIVAAGFDVQIHMPMEPEGYPGMSPGKKAIFLAQTTDENIQLIDEACAILPFAVGMNNHMGSRATSERTTMLPIFIRLKQKGMYFLDSKTSPKSICAQVAEEVGLVCIENHYFLDDSERVEEIAVYLNRAIQNAFTNGYSVVIGHPYKETYDALSSSILRNTQDGIEYITVRELSTIIRSPFYERYGY